MGRDTNRANRRRKAGSVTLVSLCLTAAMGIALSSYLALCGRSSQFSTRLLHQDKARELAVVGLEEALWALNQNNWTSSGADGNAMWVVNEPDRNVVLSYVLPYPGGSGQVTLTVANYASAGPAWPAITSTAAITLPSGEIFNKTLHAATGPAPLFGNAIGSADSRVSFTAGGTVDSWSSDPDNDPATAAVAYTFTAGNPANYNAVVAGYGSGTYGVVLNETAVRGYVATFGRPVSYSVSGSPPGSVIGPATAAGLNVDTARLGKSAFVPVSPVFGVFLPATNGPNFGGIVNGVLELVDAISGDPDDDVYETSGDLIIDGTALLFPNLTIPRPIKLIVNGNLLITSGLTTNGQIIVEPAGALEIFVAGDVTIGGDGIDNQTREPKKLAIFGTGAPSSDSLEYTSAADFYGVIYYEHRPIDIRQNATFYGALLSRRHIRFSGSATAPLFHYDTALRHVRFSNVTTPYIIQTVTEP